MPGVAIDRTDLEKATSEKVATEKVDANRAIAERITTKQAIAVIQKRGGSSAWFTRNPKSAQISWVYLWGTRITDAELEHLQGLLQLQGLELSSIKVTDAGLEHLKGLIQLKRLNLMGTKVTDAGVSELKKALPNVEIIKCTHARIESRALVVLQDAKVKAAFRLARTGHEVNDA